MLSSILIVGADGMLGRTLTRFLLAESCFEIHAFTRKPSQDLPSGIHGAHFGDCLEFSCLEEVVERARPGFIVNCVGIVKQREEAQDTVLSIEVNSLFPHRLARLCQSRNIRLIHISTDCVFCGSRGGYSAGDVCDAKDFYGRSKALGELTGVRNTITLRTSIIGRTPKSNYGLLEWFLSQQAVVSGYSQVFFSGLTTLELSKVILLVIRNDKFDGDLFNIASQRIDKASLLSIVSEVFDHRVDLIPTEFPKIDRSLDGSLFENKFSYIPPKWIDMLEEYKNWLTLV